MKNQERIKRNSCKAIIIDDNQLLCVKKSDETGPYFVIPGGGQNWGEELEKTLFRECKEEIGTEPKEVLNLVCIREFLGNKQDFPNANKNLHQIEFYWHCSIDRNKVNMGENPDSKQIGIEWINIKEIDKTRLYPEIIKDRIKKITECKKIENIYVGAAN